MDREIIDSHSDSGNIANGLMTGAIGLLGTLFLGPIGLGIAAAFAVNRASSTRRENERHFDEDLGASDEADAVAEAWRSQAGDSDDTHLDVTVSHGTQAPIGFMNYDRVTYRYRLDAEDILGRRLQSTNDDDEPGLCRYCDAYPHTAGFHHESYCPRLREDLDRPF